MDTERFEPRHFSEQLVADLFRGQALLVPIPANQQRGIPGLRSLYPLCRELFDLAHVSGESDSLRMTTEAPEARLPRLQKIVQVHPLDTAS